MNSGVCLWDPPLCLKYRVSLEVRSHESHQINLLSGFSLPLQGAEEMAKLASSCHRLQALVHVSTAYVNGTRQGLVAERILQSGDCIAQELQVSPIPDEAVRYGHKTATACQMMNRHIPKTQ
jgi:hypothetical protein